MGRLLGGGNRAIAATVYGTVLAMAALAAGAVEHLSPDALIAVVATTSGVIWLAHVYAHTLGESIERGHRLDWAELRAIGERELPDPGSRPCTDQRPAARLVRRHLRDARHLVCVRSRLCRTGGSGGALRARRAARARGNDRRYRREPRPRGARGHAQGAHLALRTERPPRRPLGALSPAERLLERVDLLGGSPCARPRPRARVRASSSVSKPKSIWWCRWLRICDSRAALASRAASSPRSSSMLRCSVSMCSLSAEVAEALTTFRGPKYPVSGGVRAGNAGHAASGGARRAPRGRRPRRAQLS